MKIVFFGFGKSGETALCELLENKFNVSKVIIPLEYNTKSVKDISQKHKIKSIEVKNTKEVETEITNMKKIDLVIIASFPFLLSKKVISFPKYGAINLHGSLLPGYRGYHPIHWAIVRGEKVTGVTIHKVSEKADAGDILSQQKIKILDSDTINSVISKISRKGAKLLVKTLEKFEQNNHTFSGKVQDENNASFAPKRNPEDGRINWKTTSRDIFNITRALQDPYPPAFFYDSKGRKVEIEKTYRSKPGKIIGEIRGYYLVSTTDGVIMIKTSKNLDVGEELK